ncbi:MAG: glycoside hydrolase family 31 protein [Anaerolineae bacterium]|nr:glycoside hydrolase family 31 protein [Anaerolineae bacterium]
MPKRKKSPQDWFSATFGPLIDQQKATFAHYAKVYAEPRATQGSWHTLMGEPEASLEGQRLRLNYANARLYVDFLTPSIVRVWLVRPGEDDAPPFSYALLESLPRESLRLQSEEQTILAPLGSQRSLASHALHHQGQILFRYSADAATSVIDCLYQPIDIAWHDGGRLRLKFLNQGISGAYGTGERTFDTNLLGRRLTFWNTDAGSYVRGFEPINTTVPLLILHNSEAYWGIFLDNSHRSVLDMQSRQTTTANHLEWEIAGGRLSFVCMSGPTLQSIVEQFTALTGRMPMPPLWALGYHQSRYSYATQAEVLEVARELRQRAIPCDVIHLDIHYMDGYRVFTWDAQAFPDPRGMSETLHAMGFKLVTILDPGVKIDPEYAVYQSGVAQDVFMKWPDGQPVAGVVWPGMTHHPDFTKPSARAWWTEQVRSFVQNYGIDGLWNDMNEPLYFSNGEAISPPDIVRHDWEGRGTTHAEAHNLYGTLMARASREGLEAAQPQRRPFNITRAGWAGAQRYASSWTGDNQATWDDLRLSIAMNIHMALSGQSFTGPDVGGFAGDTNGELLARWTQAACLLPFFRNHSAVDTIRQEPWRFGPEVERVCREAIALRYRLMPYLYTAFARCHFYGTPIIKPVLLDEGTLDDCFILGDDILVAPVLMPHTLRRVVFLPQDDERGWVDFWTGQLYPGGHAFVQSAPLDCLPLFVRSGALIPMWQEDLQNLSQWPQSGTLVLYGQASDRMSVVYEDDGEGPEYRLGKYLWRSFRVNDQGKSLELVETRQGQDRARTHYRLQRR